MPLLQGNKEEPTCARARERGNLINYAWHAIQHTNIESIDPLTSTSSVSLFALQRCVLHRTAMHPEKHRTRIRCQSDQYEETIDTRYDRQRASTLFIRSSRRSSETRPRSAHMPTTETSKYRSFSSSKTDSQTDLVRRSSSPLRKHLGRRISLSYLRSVSSVRAVTKWIACLRISRVTGGELFEDIVAREFYSEADAR